ncbi:MAG: hypothetical protein CMQ38_05815 [Gammaproteobacteria bacterium]|nr:hypothetical protein [Gammaproteobacteria bacterium]
MIRFVAGLFGKAAIKRILGGTVDLFVRKVLCADYFQFIGVMLLKNLLRRWARSTENTLDDQFVDEAIRRLEGGQDADNAQ